MKRKMLSDIENAQDKNEQQAFMKRYNQVMNLIKVNNDEYMDLIDQINAHSDDLRELDDAIKSYTYKEEEDVWNLSPFHF